MSDIYRSTIDKSSHISYINRKIKLRFYINKHIIGANKSRYTLIAMNSLVNLLSEHWGGSGWRVEGFLSFQRVAYWRKSGLEKLRHFRLSKVFQIWNEESPSAEIPILGHRFVYEKI